eukprot:8257085-Alexandrium_andersonii.AAC.1
MSASLVGSEMCIRDRLCSDRELLRLRAAPLGSNSARELLRSGAAPLGSSCLLYTSDAADDM